MSKNKDWLTRNQNNVSELRDMSPAEYIVLKLQIITLIPTSAGGFVVPEDIVRPVVSVYWLYLFLKFTYFK
jgi:hypothetical protein